MTEKLIHGNQEFVERMLQEDPDYFNHLKQGQNPEIFLLACCDSRVSPSIITGMPRGIYLFIGILPIRRWRRIPPLPPVFISP